MKTSILLGVISCIAAVTGVAHVFTPEIALPRKNTVVVLKSMDMKKTYSKFFAHLESFLDVSYVSGSKKLVLKTHEEFHYDNVFVFGSPGNKLGSDLIDFIDSGKNVVVVASSDGKTPDEILSDELRSVAVDCGVEFTQSLVKDNFGTTANVIVTDNFVDSTPITGATKPKAVHFTGVGMRLETDNPLVVPIVSASKTSYVNDHDILGKVFGSNIALVAAIQTRIGSRATFIGSTDMFSDAKWGQNSAFLARLTKWSVQWYGILRYSNVDHVKLVDGKEVRDGDMLRIRDHARFSITIEEFDGDKGEWVDFVTKKDDPVQAEYVMLDPYVRSDLKQVGKVHTADLQCPDQYGIFKFVVDYRRTGYNPLVVHHPCPLRPLKLNEYERFIVAAYPYYLSAFSAMGGFVLIGFSFLYVRD